jgi:hypothetical protein
LLLAVAVILIGSRLRAPGDAKAKQLGSMSEQWLSEHRKSRDRTYSIVNTAFCPFDSASSLSKEWRIA